MKNAKLATGLLVAAALYAAGPSLRGYVTFASWPSTPVPFYINPQSADISPASAIAAFQTALQAWSTQAGSSFRYAYGGTVNDDATSYDGRNVAMFRNSGDGSAIATTYWWNNNGTLVDADIVFWDGAFSFFTGTSGCNSTNGYGAYVEDIATHELGHALGLRHSSVAGATMEPAYGACSQEARTLAQDDIDGVQSLYGTARLAAPAAPSQLSVSLNGADPTSSVIVSWRDNATNEDGEYVERSTNGSPFVLVAQLPANTTSFTDAGLTPGVTYSYRSNAYNSTGSSTYSNTASAQTQSVSPPALPSGGATLTVSGTKIKGVPNVTLRWSGLAGSSVDVYRNSTRITTTENDGNQPDVLKKGAGSYTYKVCEVGSSVCSNSATVTF